MITLDIDKTCRTLVSNPSSSPLLNGRTRASFVSVSALDPIVVYAELLYSACKSLPTVRPISLDMNQHGGHSRSE